MAIFEINEYFKGLQKSDPSSYKKRISSFVTIVEAIETGDEQTIRETIKTSIKSFGGGYSKTYANLLAKLQVTLERDGIEPLQKELKEIDFIFNLPPHEKEEVPLTSKFKVSNRDKSNLSEEDVDEFTKPSLHQQQYVKKFIQTIIQDLQRYQDSSQRELNEVRKKMRMEESNSDSLVDLGLDFAKSKLMTGFFESGLKIDLKLTQEKIQLANTLQSNLYETLESVSEAPSERIAAAAAFFLLDALRENEELAKNSTFGGKGTLDKLIKTALQAIETYYPEGMRIAREKFEEYSVSLTKS